MAEVVVELREAPLQVSVSTGQLLSNGLQVCGSNLLVGTKPDDGTYDWLERWG